VTKKHLGILVFLLLVAGVLFASENIYIFVHDQWRSLSRSADLNKKILEEREKLRDNNVADTLRVESLKFLTEQGDLESIAKAREWLLSPNRSYRLSVLQSLANTQAKVSSELLLEVAQKFPNSDESRLVAQVLGSRLSSSAALAMARDSGEDLRFRVELLLTLISNTKDAASREPLIEEMLKQSSADPSVLTYTILSLGSEVRTSAALATRLRVLAKAEAQLSNEQKMAVLEALALAPKPEDRDFWEAAAASQDEQVLKIAVTRAERFCSPKWEDSLRRIAGAAVSVDLKGRATRKLEQIKRENLCPGS